MIVAGHDEYWTSRMRDAFEAARDAGVNLAFFGANIGYWQMRYETATHDRRATRIVRPTRSRPAPEDRSSSAS